MKTLRLLNIAGILLLFTPFFQMCSDNETEAVVAEDNLSRQLPDPGAARIVIDRDTVDAPRGPSSHGKMSSMERLWELITFPDDNLTTTGFGLLVITLLAMWEGQFSDIWIGSVLIDISLILTVSTLVLLFKKRLDTVVPLLTLNIVLTLAAFIAAVFTFDSISQIKWGYYLYLTIIALLLGQARRSIRPRKPPLDLARP